MNTIFTIAQEVGFNLIWKLRSAGFDTVYLREQRAKMIASVKRSDIMKRITDRGNREQYQNRFLPNYYGCKRLSKSHVFTANTI